jgi:hypothetical protein
VETPRAHSRENARGTRCALRPVVIVRLALTLALVLALLPSPARAHGADANQIQIVLRGQRAEVLATPPVSAIAFADADGDGRLTRDELAAERPAVLQALLDSVWLADERARPGDLVRADVSVPAEPDPSGLAGHEFVRLSWVLAWSAPPSALSLEAGFVGEHPVGVVAQRAEAGARPGVLVLVGAPDARVIDGASGMITLLDEIVASAPRSLAARPSAPRAVAAPAPSSSLVQLVVVALAALGALATRRGLALLAPASTRKGHA